MKIKVEHEVPYDKGLENKCEYAGDFWGNEICPYCKRRDRTHGRKAPVERKVLECTLFDKWLDEPYKKCPECLARCEEAVMSENSPYDFIDNESSIQGIMDYGSDM